MLNKRLNRERQSLLIDNSWIVVLKKERKFSHNVLKEHIFMHRFSCFRNWTFRFKTVYSGQKGRERKKSALRTKKKTFLDWV